MKNYHRCRQRKGKNSYQILPFPLPSTSFSGYLRGQPLRALIILHPHQLPAPREHEALSILIIPRFPADTHSRPKSSWTVVPPVVGGCRCKRDRSKSRKAHVWNIWNRPISSTYSPGFVANFGHLQRSWVAGEQGNDGSNSSWAGVIIAKAKHSSVVEWLHGWTVGLWQGSHFDERVHVHRWDPGYPDPPLNLGYDAETRHQSSGWNTALCKCQLKLETLISLISLPQT